MLDSEGSGVVDAVDIDGPSGCEAFEKIGSFVEATPAGAPLFFSPTQLDSATD